MIALTSALSRCARPLRGLLCSFGVARSAIRHWLVQCKWLNGTRRDSMINTLTTQHGQSLNRRWLQTSSSGHYTATVISMWLPHKATYLQYRHSYSVYNWAQTHEIVGHWGVGVVWLCQTQPYFSEIFCWTMKAKRSDEHVERVM
jgi:hypothetical protein